MNVGTRMQAAGLLGTLRTLDDVVDHYLKTFSYEKGDKRGDGRHDGIVDYCKEAPSLEEGVKIAVANRQRNGKMFSSGSCVRTESRKALSDLLTLPAALRHLETRKTFEEVYDFVEAQGVWGISSHSVYNISARIAARLGINPKDFIYLHAGPLRGWKKLTGKGERRKRIPMSEVPAAFHRLEPHRVEDLLCEYRDTLKQEMIQ